MKDTLILAIESSCDETAASVVKNGRTILSNVISSQIELHKLYGGVVPEIASRKHIEKVNQVVEEALKDANICFIFTEWQEIKDITPDTYKKLMKPALVYDGRNIHSLQAMKDAGVEYYSIGR